MKARTMGVLGACVLAALPRSAEAVEVNGGVSAGGIMAGVVPRLAISPHVGLSWRTDGGFLFEVHTVASILPLRGVGVFSETSAAIGYASERATFGAGPSLAAYSMTACSDVVCGRSAGLAPGGHTAATFYFAGPLGVAINAHAAWVGGNSLVLPGGVAVVVVAGPALRWRSE